MADNFENQVQDKMAGLSLQPSEGVWKKVELRIEKKKKRRWIFLLIFPALLAGGFWYWKQSSPADKKNDVYVNRELKTKIPGTSKSIKKGEAKNSNLQAITSTSTQEAVSSQNDRAITNDSALQSKTHRAIKDKETIRINKQADQSSNKQVIRQSNTQVAQSSNKQTSQPSTEGVILKSVSPQEKTTIASVEKDSPASLSDINKQAISIKENTKDTSTGLSPLSIVDPKMAIMDSSSHSPSSNSAKKNLWHTGLLFTAGISSLGNNYPGLANYPVNLTTGYSGGAIPLPSTLKAGFGFTIGIQEEKSITAKTKLVTGLNITLLSTSFRIGTDSGVLSTQNASAKYNNHYSFIELPFSFKFQLGGMSKTPFYAQAGLVLSEMIGSNALQVGSNGIYHRDNSLFNKTQLGFNGSLSFSIFPKQRNSIAVGPYVYYGATSMAKTGMYAQKHFVFVGLQTQVEFGKH